MQVVWDPDSAVGSTGYHRRTSQSTLLEKNERFSYCLSAASITIRRLRRSQQVQKTMFQTVRSCHKQSSKHLWSSLYSWDLSHVDTYPSLLTWNWGYREDIQDFPHEFTCERHFFLCVKNKSYLQTKNENDQF